MRRFLPAAFGVAVLLSAAGLILWLRTEPGTAPEPVSGQPVRIDLTEPEPIAPPPAPAGPATVEVPGTAGRIMPVAAPESAVLTAEGERLVLDFARRTGTEALLIWQGGALQLEFYGAATQPFDRLDGRGLQAGLLTLLAGQAVRDGYIPSLEDPVVRWIGEWKDDPRGRITLRQLLQGTSGLDLPAGEPVMDDTLAWTLAGPLAAAPETRFAPNLMEMQVLGLVLARAAGQPLPTYLSERLWQPLGARTAEMRLGADGTPVLTCCFAATPRDWLRIGLLLLEGGAVAGQPLVSTPWVDDVQRPTPWSRNDGTRVRLAWPFDPKGPLQASAAFREPDTVFLTGDGGQRIYVARGADLVILRLGAEVERWDEAELPNLVARHLEVQQARPRKAGGDLSGIELPPITTPPPIPSVEAVPLDAPAAE